MFITVEEKDKKRSAIVDGVLKSMGVQVKNPAPGHEYFKGASLQWLCRTALEESGYDVRKLSTKAQVARETLIRIGSMSTNDFDSILLDITNKNLRTAYEQAPRTFLPFCRIVSGDNFKNIHGVTLSEAPDLDLISENGEYKSGELSDAQEIYSVKSYGKIIYLTRQMIINDDMKAFLRLPQLFGAAAARKESDIVYGKIVGNPAMADGIPVFHLDHNNLVSDAPGIGPVTAERLSAGRRIMRDQTGITNVKIDLRPQYVLVPAEQETNVEIIVRSRSLPEDNKSSGVHNPWGSLIPISDPRLDDDSSMAWYLIASPDQIDTIEIAYLDGQSEPYTEEHTFFNRDAIGFKVRHEFGVGLMDYRGFFKNSGE